ncbi:chaplin [Streptomyces sp. NPDC088812]|uniref:chaplin n=1 Tax=Streptomyces sp. NPDC088812 TaxID=3365905 RepID=UPI0037F34B25
MRRVTRNGVIAVAAASGAMAMTMPAFADSAANGTAAGSPGVIAGNTVQVPVHLPVNLCGNTVNVVGLLNPAAGNTCVNEGSGHSGAKPGHGAKPGGGARPGHSTKPGGGATATSSTAHSPGVVSGNGVQTPVDLPVNATGNSVDVVGILNPVFGNESVNTSGGEPAPQAEPAPEPPRNTPPAASRPGPTGPKTVPAARAPQAPAPQAPEVPEAVGESLARTGADATVPAAVGSAALVLGGALLYRRYRPGVRR